jgi:nicotinamidase-related amidase
VTISKLDARTALVLNDMQKGVLRLRLSPYPRDQVVGQCVKLATAFQRHGLAVILVAIGGPAPGRVERDLDLPEPPGPDFAEIIDEFAHQLHDMVIPTRRWGAFYGTYLDSELRQRGITQVVFGGVSTSSGVESSARAAFDLGFNVAVAVDAVADFDAEAHRNSIGRVFPRMAETDVTDRIIELLDSRDQ